MSTRRRSRKSRCPPTPTPPAAPSAPEELELLRQVIESGTLNCTKGTQVKALREALRRAGSACRTAAPSPPARRPSTAAVAAIDPEPGDEIITTPITDMGAIAPILYQAAIPVFADVDPLTYNVTAETIAAQHHPPHARRSSSRTSSATRATWTRSWSSRRSTASR